MLFSEWQLTENFQLYIYSHAGGCRYFRRCTKYSERGVRSAFHAIQILKGTGPACITRKSEFAGASGAIRVLLFISVGEDPASASDGSNNILTVSVEGEPLIPLTAAAGAPIYTDEYYGTLLQQFI